MIKGLQIHQLCMDEQLSAEISYSADGRMLYHPDFHHNHGKPFTTEELVYLAKFYEHDGCKMIGHALGRTEGVIQSTAAHMKKQGVFEIYKNLSDDDWLKLITAANRSAQSRRN